MLRTMRSNLKTLSWTLWLVILAFVGFIFVEWGMGTNAIGGDNTNYLMSVDGETITMQDFKYYQSLYKLTNPQTLQMLKQSSILSYEAQKMNMIVSKQELNSQIFNLFQYKGVFMGMDQYRQFLTSNHMNVKSFEDFLKRFFILPRKYTDFIMNSGGVINEETLAKKFHTAKDYAQIEYIKIAPEWIKDEIKITDKERTAYYKKHKKNYFSKEARVGLVVSMKSESIKKNNLVSDKEIEAYYKSHLSQFQKKEKIRVSRIFLNYTKKNKKDIEILAKEIKKDLTAKNFSQKAKEFSQDEKKPNGGDWGYNLDKLIRKEKKIARNMEVNEISDLIYTGKSISILHVTEKSDEKITPLALVKNKIIDKLTPTKVEKIAKTRLLSVIKKLKKGVKIDEIKADDLIIKKTGLVHKDQVILGLDESSTLANKLFTLKNKGVSNIIELIQNTKQNYGIVKCINIKKAGIEKLENVKDKLDKDIIIAKKADLLKVKTPELTKTLNSIKDKDAVKKYLDKQKLISDTFKYRRGNRLLYFPEKDGLDDMIFSLKPGMYSAPIIYDNNAVIVKLNSKKITTNDDYQKERLDFYKKTLQYKQSIDWQNFISAKIEILQKDKKIRMNSKKITELLKQQKNEK